MSATSGSPSSVWIRIVPSVAGATLGSSLSERAEPQLDAEGVELTAEFVAQILAVGTGEDVLGDIGERHVLVRIERLDLAGKLEAGGTGADDQRAVGGQQRLMGGTKTGPGGSDVGLFVLGRERVRRARGEHQVVRLEYLT